MCLRPSSPSSSFMILLAISSISLVALVKLRYLQPYIMGGHAERMCTSLEFLYENGAKEVHIRSACPPIMYGCKYLNFSRSVSDMELISRRTIVELEGEEGLNHLEEYADGSTERGKAMRNAIADKFHFSSLEFQTLEGTIEAIGLEPCKLCTYCWNGKG